MSPELIAIISFTLLGLTIIPLTLFIVFYAVRSQWTTTRIGRMLMGKSIALWAVLVLTIYSGLFEVPPAGGFLYIGIPLAVLIGYTGQFIVLIKVQNGADNETTPWWDRFLCKSKKDDNSE